LGLDIVVNRLEKRCDRLAIGGFSNSSRLAIVHCMESVYPKLKEEEEAPPLWNET
jgi:hypothetical protein